MKPCLRKRFSDHPHTKSILEGRWWPITFRARDFLAFFPNSIVPDSRSIVRKTSLVFGIVEKLWRIYLLSEVYSAALASAMFIVDPRQYWTCIKVTGIPPPRLPFVFVELAWVFIYYPQARSSPSRSSRRRPATVRRTGSPEATEGCRPPTRPTRACLSRVLMRTL